MIDLKHHNIPSSALWKPLSGGSINRVFLIDAQDGRQWVIKINDVASYPGMFAAERKGLGLLGAYVSVPGVLGEGVVEDKAYLLLEYLGNGNGGGAFQRSLGRQLAKMHMIPQVRYGLDYDNYIGSLPQQNIVSSEWSEFFRERRLRPQVEMAVRSGLLSKEDENAFERLYTKLPDIFPEEPPALLHGDLWDGNVHCSDTGLAYFIDPAIYVGHREMDIAMTRLFGGFADDFYSAYNEVYPLAHGSKLRTDIANLYPNLVHINLFGGGYVGAVRAVMGRF